MITPTLTCSSSWPLILDSLLPPVAALLGAIALWVAARARGISKDAQLTSLETSHYLATRVERRSPSASPRTALDPRKPSSSTEEGSASTFTSLGD